MKSNTHHLLQGKTALVTGASRGIGRAIAQRLAADGALVAIHYGGNDAAANETLKTIEQTGGQAFLVKAELGVKGDVDTLFSKLEKGLADRPLDILINNAAVAPQIALAQTTPEEFNRIFAINVRAPFFIIQRALALMPDGGRIINISSGVTWFATPATVYSMTKGALNVLSRSLANSLGDRHITVNTISPGITDTDMNPSIRDKEAKAIDRVAAITALGRPGRADDIADVVAFFASDDARWITGQTLDVNGGLFLGPKE
jgi:NAD(P)-dependent dehydrogenase (short-subunit alcohol dehydrogenase family)